MGIKSCIKETPLNVIKLGWMEVPPNGTLDMNESLYLTICYLLKDERFDLEFKSDGWMAKA